MIARKNFEEQGKKEEKAFSVNTSREENPPRGAIMMMIVKKDISRSEHAPSEAHTLSPAGAKELAATSDARRVRRHRSGARCRCNVPGVVLLCAWKDFVRFRGEVEVEAIVHLAVLLASLAAVGGETAGPGERAEGAVGVAAL